MLSRTLRRVALGGALRCASLAAVPLALAAPSVALAEDADATLAKAEKAYADLDFQTAYASAQAALAAGNLSHDQLVRATRVLALSAAATDKSSEAKDAFIALLTYDPSYTVDSKLGPRYREPFNEARGYWAAQSSKPGMETSAMVSPHAPGSIRVVTRDPTRAVKTVVVSHRWAPAKVFVQHAAKTGDAHVDVPAPPAGSTRLDYFVRAEDAKGNVVFEDGSAASPKFSVVPVESAAGGTAKENKSVFASPVFWIIAGAVIAGGATAAVLAATQGGGTETVVSNRWTPALSCGGARCE